MPTFTQSCGYLLFLFAEVHFGTRRSLESFCVTREAEKSSKARWPLDLIV
jgi:hypothetical protein